MAAAAAFPLRLALHYSSTSHPSRPMAALIVPDQSREGYESTRAGYEMLSLPPYPAGSLRCLQLALPAGRRSP
jgi:hypothetical protein